MKLSFSFFKYFSSVMSQADLRTQTVDRRTFFGQMLGLTALSVIGSSCSSSSSSGFPGKNAPVPMVSVPIASTPLVNRSPKDLKNEVNWQTDLVASGHYCRWKVTRLKPTYITIHATSNRSAGATAYAHARGIKNGAFKGGKIGYLSWHFTVDQNVAIQHLPLNEIGHHAEYGYGPGNMNSIGIEMCENRGNSLRFTFDRTAKLVACLMMQYDIPLKNVVGHYNWTGKNCPDVLLERGRPGYRWKWFLSRVDYYYRCINGGTSHLV